MKLSSILTNEINAANFNGNTPDVNLFIDEAGNIFWLTKNQEYVWLSQESNFESFVDGDHQPKYDNRPEGVMNNGVIWSNKNLENPFHISEFEKAISTITI